ncbi:MFS transporter [Sphaerochaeta sp. PS]|uniref:MFS transporter n=1 Tax=Sphaerochaeta sp. PS TaxID=3076336 RepID=UPI0028A506D6|nr:MFS transporter [Sphaerochaeta sp. PS]MDT4763110.1 MFS transporter [Sphaerochaeta sp. PS]
MALLIIIYISFISLGLPDAVLGSAWPVMHVALALPLWSAGLVAAVVSMGTVVSALFSTKVITRFGTGKVTMVSVLLTALALLGFSLSTNLAMLMLFALPLGLGAGSVDTALNNYVALHFKARHMSWLHSFWGVGASLGPAIVSLALTLGYSYRGGYLAIGTVQMLLVVVLFSSRSLWKDREVQERGEVNQSNLVAMKIKGVPFALLTFYLYCSLEIATGLWAPTYLVQVKGLDPTKAALWGGLYYLGITIGRIASGFITFRVSNNKMTLGGLVVCLASLLLFLSSRASVSGIALFMLGLGSGPIFPSMIHETPRRFGVESSQAIIGLQMATAYIGNMVMPPVVGALASTVGLVWLPVLQAFLIVAMMASVLRLVLLGEGKGR